MQFRLDDDGKSATSEENDMTHREKNTSKTLTVCIISTVINGRF
jgi:hypothetical protein